MDKTTVIKDITSECITLPYGEGLCVMYKGVPLWYTIYHTNPSDIENCTISLVLDEYELSEDGETTEDTISAYSIIGKTPIHGYTGEYDYTTYGDWVTYDEASNWLDNPIALY